MKKQVIFILGLITILSLSCSSKKNQWIRINQLGYKPGDIKVAVFLSYGNVNIKSFSIVDVATGKEFIKINDVIKSPSISPFSACYRLPFSSITKPGLYRIEAGKAVSPDFRIADDVYDNTSDFLLKYMRQQRCGFNPFINDSCHIHDGYEIYGERDDKPHIDVTGGWHDAADYLQYVATSANAVYQMFFAYSKNPGAFCDNHLQNGLPGTDGIPDVLNEARWGLEWLLKMNPAPGIMYNQLADDRDHVGFRMPNDDKADYGKGKERPVYRCTGKVQGLFGNLNRVTGIASTAGKFASAFAIAGRIYRASDPDFSRFMTKKAADAFDYGLKNPGVCQTAPGTAPYFYEEDNYADDMELAAAELYKLTRDPKYLQHALEFGRLEPVTPWMGADTARHYQWYPFMNMGHPAMAGLLEDVPWKQEFRNYMKEGLSKIKAKGENNPFLIGVPFIWCSNNLVAATLTQAHLYAEITGDKEFAEMEAAHRDWLFGCNPWGTSMIVGLPENGDYPEDTHSSYVHVGMQVPGGLVDGPVYPSIFNSLKGIAMANEDEYAGFQNSMAVYHDDFADYSTNECTMDGTACLVYYLSAMQTE